MSKSNHPRWVDGALAVACLSIILAGCGGGGAAGVAGPAGGTGTGSTPNASNATAKFHVDVKTGKVSVTPLNGPTNNKAFRGSAIGFTSSVLIDQPGDTGRKVMRVTLTNNSGEPIGQSGYGVNVLFSNFTNVSGFSDLRPKTVVSTYAGTGNATSTDGPLLSATMTHPQGAVIGVDGALYFTESSKIRRASGGVVTTFAGSTAGYRDGAGANALFNTPSGICVDSSGYFWVCDTGNNRIRRISPDGRVTTVAGTGAATSTDGSGDTATLHSPFGITFGNSSQLYITEDGNYIRTIQYAWDSNTTPSDYTLATIAGSGVGGSADGIGPAATFSHPRGIAYDSNSNNLFVADLGSNKIRRVSPTGEVVTVAGSGTAADTDGLGTAAAFNQPMGITDLNGTLYISEYTGKRIRQMSIYNQGNNTNSPTGWLVASLAGTGVAGIANGTGDVATFTNPLFLTVDSASNLYVCDYGANNIRKVRPGTGFFPIGIATGAAPAEPVQLFNADGVIPNSGYGSNLPFVNYASSFSTGSSDQKDWVFIVPSGVTAFEFSVTVESATAYGAPVQVGTNVGSANVDVRTLARAKPGFVDGRFSEARFGNFDAVAVDARGDLFVADTSNNSIRVMGTNGQVATIAGIAGKGAGNVDGAGTTAQFSAPTGIAVTSDGATVYVADSGNNEIRRLSSIGPEQDAANWQVTTIAGAAAAGKADGAGNAASFDQPYGIALSPGGLLYVTEKAGNRVRRLMFKGGDAGLNTQWQVNTVAGDNAAAVGAAGTTDATGIAARFSAPEGIAVDRAGTLVVADSANNRVRKVTSDGVVTTLAGSTAGYGDALGAAALFSTPAGIAVDSSNYIYVADSGNNRVRRVSPSGQVNTVAGIAGIGVVDGPGNTCRFAVPTAIAVDSLATLYVGDFNVGTMRLVQPVLVGMKR